MPSFSIRAMSPDDATRVRTIRLRALSDSPDAFGTLWADEKDRPVEMWTTRLKNPEAVTLVASEGDEDVGLATSLPWPGREGALGLFSMWVAPEARGQGVGRAIVERVAAWGRERGYRRIYLGVGDYNEPAITLYRRCGYKRTGETGSLPEPRAHILEHERVLEL